MTQLPFIWLEKLVFAIDRVRRWVFRLPRPLTLAEQVEYGYMVIENETFPPNWREEIQAEIEAKHVS